MTKQHVANIAIAFRTNTDMIGRICQHEQFFMGNSGGVTNVVNDMRPIKDAHQIRLRLPAIPWARSIIMQIDGFASGDCRFSYGENKGILNYVRTPCGIIPGICNAKNLSLIHI